MSKLFEYAIILNPLQTKEQKEKGIKEKAVIVVPVTQILATDEREANVLASRAIPDKYIDQLHQLEIVLRPF